MCIILYKPEGVDFPKKKVIQACFDNNSDGAGFCYVAKGEVRIEKGFMGFKTFWKALRTARDKFGDSTPYVLHFRISTQAGVNQECCHPYPLSKDMNDLRQLRYSCDMAIAHNGIIDLTSASYYSKTKVTYNDTMKFITDYLSLIIKDRSFWKDQDTVDLIEKLVDSKLAILDSTGHCTLIGNFVEEYGCYFSNSTYKAPKYSATAYKFDNYYTNINKPYWWGVPTDADEPSMDNCIFKDTGNYDICEICPDYNNCPMWFGTDDEAVEFCRDAKSPVVASQVPELG